MLAEIAERLVADVTVGCNALLDVKDQTLGAVCPIALSVLADDSSVPATSARSLDSADFF